MACADFIFKVGDLLPTFDVTLLSNGSGIVLANIGSVNFFMKDSAGTLKVDGGSMGFVTNGSDGQVSYAWESGNTNTAGDYTAEVVLVWDNGKKQTFPNDRDLVIKILEDVE